MGVVGPATKPHDFTEYPFLIHFVHLQDEMGEVDEELLMAKMFNFYLTVPKILPSSQFQ